MKLPAAKVLYLSAQALTLCHVRLAKTATNPRFPTRCVRYGCHYCVSLSAFQAPRESITNIPPQ